MFLSLDTEHWADICELNNGKENSGHRVGRNKLGYVRIAQLFFYFCLIILNTYWISILGISWVFGILCGFCLRHYSFRLLLLFEALFLPSITFVWGILPIITFEEFFLSIITYFSGILPSDCYFNELRSGCALSRVSIHEQCRVFSVRILRNLENLSAKFSQAFPTKSLQNSLSGFQVFTNGHRQTCQS